MKIKKRDAKSAYIKGSRIPISYFFNYMKHGYSLSDFLSSYPWIKKEDLVKKLDEFEQEVDASYVF